MIALGAGRIYLAREAVDLRKSIDGLVVLVQQSLQHDPFDTSLYVFTNRRRDKLKLLIWDVNGFWLHYKRLERSHFRWPVLGAAAVGIEPRQLEWLLAGLSLEQREALPKVNARVAC